MIGKTIKNIADYCDEFYILYTDGTISKFEAGEEYGETYLYVDQEAAVNDYILMLLDVISEFEYNKRYKLIQDLQNKINIADRVASERKELKRLKKKYE